MVFSVYQSVNRGAGLEELKLTKRNIELKTDAQNTGNNEYYGGCQALSSMYVSLSLTH